MIDDVISLVRRAGDAARDTRSALREGLAVSERQLVAAGESAVDRVQRRKLIALHNASGSSPAVSGVDALGDVSLVAPISGALAFAAWTHRCAVAVAVRRGGAPVLSVTYAPEPRKLFAAEKGSGAFDADGNPGALLVTESGGAILGENHARLSLAPPYRRAQIVRAGALSAIHTLTSPNGAAMDPRELHGCNV